MVKNELLKTLGFSDQFLKEIDDYNNRGISQFNIPVSSNNFLDFTVNDTSDIFIKKAIRKDSDFFIIQQQPH